MTTPRLSSIIAWLVNTSILLGACQRTPPPVDALPAQARVTHSPTPPVSAPSAPDMDAPRPDHPDLATPTPRFTVLEEPLTPQNSCSSPPVFTKPSFPESNQIARDHDPSIELVHFPSALDADTSAFRRKRDRLYLPTSTRGKEEEPLAWSPPRPTTASPTHTGLVRARLVPDGRLDATLMLRHTLENASPHGVGVAFSPEGVALVYTEDGRSFVPLTRTEILYNLKKREELEVIATVLDTHIHVQIHDARSGVELASLATSLPDEMLQTPSPVHPWLHVSSHHASSSRAHLTLLSSRSLCHPDLPAPKALERPPRIFAVLTAEQADALALSEPITSAHDAAQRYQLTRDELEQLHCLQTPPSSLSTEIPWMALDEDYRTYRDHPVVKSSQGGFHTALSLKNPEMVHALMSAFHERYPSHTRLVEIGRSHRDTPIMAMAIARDLQEHDPRPSLLLNGAHHGDEPMSTEIVFDAMRTLLVNPDDDPGVDTWLDAFVIWLVPQVNPDGARAFLETSYRMGRKNGRHTEPSSRDPLARGVDLNRNYPFQWGELGEEGSSSDASSEHYRGESSASEPETRALMALAEQEHFAASISYHTGTVCVIAPYTIDGVPQPRINDAWSLGRHISRRMPEHPEGRSFRLLKNLYPVDGTDQDWFRAEFGTAALLVEAVRRTPRDTCSRLAIIEANRPSYTLLFERMLKGPAITGQVRDADGDPIVAEVIIEEQGLKAGERWQTRARDGHFFRLLTRRGTYTLRVEAEGFETFTQRVKVSNKAPALLDVVLSARDVIED